MLPIRKFIVGIRPAQKMFRIGTLAGSIIDSVLEARSDKELGETYFTEVGKTDDVGYVISNVDEGNVLRLERDNIVFMKDLYPTERKFDFDVIISEWKSLWKVIQSVLAVRNVRRIGIAAEHQFEAKGGLGSRELLRGFCSGSSGDHPAGFNLHFEERRPATGRTGLPNVNKDAFINILRDYYDSEIDTDYKKVGHINANLDVQKYYSPPFNGNVFAEVTDLFKVFSHEKEISERDLKARGLI